MSKAKDFQGQLKEMPGSSRLQSSTASTAFLHHGTSESLSCACSTPRDSCRFFEFTSQGGTEHPSAVNKKWLSATSSSKSCTANLQASLIMIQKVEEKPIETPNNSSLKSLLFLQSVAVLQTVHFCSSTRFPLGLCQYVPISAAKLSRRSQPAPQRRKLIQHLCPIKSYMLHTFTRH